MISKEFVLAGCAIFTVSNGRGEHYTFKVLSPAFGMKSHACYVLSGSNNETDYKYLCSMKDCQCHTNRITKPFEVLQWAIRRIWRQDGLPEGYRIQHAGRCGKCGRPLTTPDSIESGLGPKCRGKV